MRTCWRRRKKQSHPTIFIISHCLPLHPRPPQTQDDRAAPWEPGPDPTSSKPQHKCQRINGQGKCLAKRGYHWKLFPISMLFCSENLEKTRGDSLSNQHLHCLHHRKLPHDKDHSKCLGDYSQVNNRRSLFLKSSCSLFARNTNLFHIELWVI